MFLVNRFDRVRDIDADFCCLPWDSGLSSVIENLVLRNVHVSGFSAMKFAGMTNDRVRQLVKLMPVRR